MLEPGQQAPEFELPNHDGETVKLSDFEGQQVVLYFYPKAGTEGCTLEAREFDDSWSEFEQRDISVVGVSTDSVEEVATFKDELGLPFPLLSDESGAVAKQYDSFDTPEIDGETVEIALRNTYVIGPDGTIEAAYEGVSPEGHPDQLLSDLSEDDRE
jgi:peroxiredoxin Q/BCP